MKIANVLFVCHANHCRSPVAEHMFKKYADSSVQAGSAGLEALVGHSVDDRIASKVSKLGYDLSGHRGRNVTIELLRNADIVLVMDGWNQVLIQKQWPFIRGRVFKIGSVCNSIGDIQDPYMKSDLIIDDTIGKLELACNAWANYVMSINAKCRGES